MPEIKGISIPNMTEDRKEKFWSKVALTANMDICWLWNGEVKDIKKPYGRFRIDNKYYSATRISFFLCKENPNQFHVLHTCDNPKCVNPNHLFLGTNNDNVQDKVSKGRQARNVAWNKGISTGFLGVKNPAVVLTESQVIKIRNSYVKGVLGTHKLGRMFGVSKQTINDIISKKTWKHI